MLIMPDEGPEAPKVNVVQEEADHYQVYSATGVLGGVQIRGNVLLDFVLDRNVPAHTETYSLEDGNLGELVGTEGNNYISREKQVGISMSQANAYDMATHVIADLFEVTSDEITDTLTKDYPEKFE